MWAEEAMSKAARDAAFVRGAERSDPEWPEAMRALVDAWDEVVEATRGERRAHAMAARYEVEQEVHRCAPSHEARRVALRLVRRGPLAPELRDARPRPPQRLGEIAPGVTGLGGMAVIGRGVADR